MKKLLILIPVLLIGCTQPSSTTEYTPKEIYIKAYMHKGKSLTCVGTDTRHLSCDWVAYHKE